MANFSSLASISGRRAWPSTWPGGDAHRRWRTFLRNHADGIAAMDLFVVPTISFRLLYGLLILRHDRRRILWLGATTHPTAEWIARQLVEVVDGTRLRAILSMTEIDPMARCSFGEFAPWASEIQRDAHGCTDATRRRGRRSHTQPPRPGRTASSLGADLICDRHNGTLRQACLRWIRHERFDTAISCLRK